MSKLKEMTSTWTITVAKLTKFGFYYRWYLPKFIYSWVMHDLQFIERGDTRVYTKAGYKRERKSKL